MVTSLDLYPTLAAVAGAEVPDDRVIDGSRIGGLVGIDDAAPEPERPFPYILDGSIEAIRIGRWKLHVRKRQRELVALYDLHTDVGETTDLSAQHPDVVRALLDQLDAWRAELGDEATGAVGRGVRPLGRVDEARPLTSFDPEHPYYMAEYDLPDRG